MIVKTVIDKERGSEWKSLNTEKPKVREASVYYIEPKHLKDRYFYQR